ncbi:MAG: hypothetical protein H0X18_18040 [Geodermatophilaceae bacterium]|nr:hypothetical protein [Geodermatophilaceae bacterium]
MAESGSGEGSERRAPASVRRAAAIVALEGLAVMALGPVLLFGGILSGRPDSLGRAWAEVVIAVAAGALILFLARSLSQMAGWSRAPVVVTQILAAPVGYSLAFPSGQPLFGIPVLLAAAAVLYLVFTPESNLALFRDLRR